MALSVDTTTDKSIIIWQNINTDETGQNIFNICRVHMEVFKPFQIRIY